MRTEPLRLCWGEEGDEQAGSWAMLGRQGGPEEPHEGSKVSWGWRGERTESGFPAFPGREFMKALRVDGRSVSFQKKK